MTKKLNEQKSWNDESIKNFLEWYVQELKNPSGEVEQVPFLIDIKYTKKDYEAVTIIGEKKIQKYLDEKKERKL